MQNAHKNITKERIPSYWLDEERARFTKAKFHQSVKPVPSIGIRPLYRWTALMPSSFCVPLWWWYNRKGTDRVECAQHTRSVHGRYPLHAKAKTRLTTNNQLFLVFAHNHFDAIHFPCQYSNPICFCFFAFLYSPYHGTNFSVHSAVAIHY